MSSTNVIAVSTGLYLATQFFIYWGLAKALPRARSILLSPFDGTSASSVEALQHDEVAWLAYVGALVQVPLAVGLAMLELARVEGADTRLPPLYATILFIQCGGTFISAAVYWRQLRKRMRADRRKQGS